MRKLHGIYEGIQHTDDYKSSSGYLGTMDEKKSAEYEKLVKELKKNKDVKNPWALAHHLLNKKKKVGEGVNPQSDDVLFKMYDSMSNDELRDELKAAQDMMKDVIKRYGEKAHEQFLWKDAANSLRIIRKVMRSGGLTEGMMFEWAYRFSNKQSQIKQLKEFVKDMMNSRIENDVNDPDWDEELVGDMVEDQLTGLHGEVNGKDTNDVFRSLTDGMIDREINQATAEIEDLVEIRDGWAYYDGRAYKNAVKAGKTKIKPVDESSDDDFVTIYLKDKNLDQLSDVIKDLEEYYPEAKASVVAYGKTKPSAVNIYGSSKKEVLDFFNNEVKRIYGIEIKEVADQVVNESKKAPFKVGDKVTFKKDAKYFKDYIGKELTVAEVIPPIKAWGESPLNKKHAAEPYFGIKIAEIPEAHLLKDFSIQKVGKTEGQDITKVAGKDCKNYDDSTDQCLYEDDAFDQKVSDEIYNTALSIASKNDQIIEKETDRMARVLGIPVESEVRSQVHGVKQLSYALQLTVAGMMNDRYYKDAFNFINESLNEDFAFKFPHMTEVMRLAKKLEGYLNKAAAETGQPEVIADLAKKAKEINDALINIQHDMMDKSYQVGDFKKWIGSSRGHSALGGKLENGKWTFKIVKTSDKSVKIDGSKDEKYQFNNPTELSKFLDDNFDKLEREAEMMYKKESVNEDLNKEGNKLLKDFLSKKSSKDVIKHVSGELPELNIGDVSYMYGNSELIANTEDKTFVWVVDQYGDRHTFELFSVTNLEGKEIEENKVIQKEDKNPIADYEVTVEIPVEQAAEMVSKKGDLKKALDLDYMELGGYDVDPTKYNLPKGFDGADVYFKNAVKQAIYSADEFAALSAYHKAAIDAVVERFEKVEPTTMEYAGDTSKGEQSFVSAVAGVTSAHYDKKSGKVVVTIKNPHHLINGIISGVGLFGVDLPIDEKIDEKETMDRLHNIIDYYDVWGERMPEIDERAGENASWDDDMFKEELIFRIGETTEADLIEDLLEIPKDEEIDMDKIMKIEGNPFKKKNLEKIINKIERIRAKHKEADDIKGEEKQLKEDDIGDDPAVYVGTYGKYNSGSIDGAWVNLNKYPTKDEFYDHIKELHKDEEDPEFMFQDYQNFPERFYGESGLSEKIWDWLELDEDDRELLEAYIEATGDDKVSIDDAKDKFQGKYDSKEDWAQEFINQSGGLGDSAHYYLSISDLDARLIAQDEATSLAEDMRYSLKKEDYDEVFDRTDKFKEEYEALKEKLDKEEDEDNQEKIKEEIEKLAEKSIEEWESEYSDEVEQKIKDDVVGYFVDEGIYSLEDLSKQSFISIDYEKFVRDSEINGDFNFVNKDGEYFVFMGN